MLSTFLWTIFCYILFSLIFSFSDNEVCDHLSILAFLSSLFIFIGFVLVEVMLTFTIIEVTFIISFDFQRLRLHLVPLAEE